MDFKLAALLYCAAVLTPIESVAQQNKTAPSPIDPAAAVPSAKYESVFTGYSQFRDEKLVSWREVNDDAARVGGHMGIFGSGAGHAGHGAAKPQAQPPGANAKPSVQSAPPMTHGGAHEGMKK